MKKPNERILGDQLYQKEMPTQGLLHKYFPASFEKSYKHEFGHLCNNVKERVCDLEFSNVFFIKRCSLLH